MPRRFYPPMLVIGLIILLALFWKMALEREPQTPKPAVPGNASAMTYLEEAPSKPSATQVPSREATPQTPIPSVVDAATTAAKAPLSWTIILVDRETSETLNGATGRRLDRLVLGTAPLELNYDARIPSIDGASFILEESPTDNHPLRGASAHFWLDGYTPIVATIALFPDQDTRTDTIRIPMAKVMHRTGTVQNPKGEKIPWALITVSPNHEPQPVKGVAGITFALTQPYFNTVAEENGDFVLANAPAIAPPKINVTAPGYYGETLILQGEAEQIPTITLNPEMYSLRGLVFDETGSPLPDIQLSLVRLSHTSDERTVAQQFRTDSEGRFLRSGIEAGPVEIIASKQAVDGTTQESSIPVEVTENTIDSDIIIRFSE